MARHGWTEPKGQRVITRKAIGSLGVAAALVFSTAVVTRAVVAPKAVTACDTDAEACLADIQAVINRHATTTTTGVPTSTSTSTTIGSTVPPTTTTLPGTTTTLPSTTTSTTAPPSTTTTVPAPSGFPNASNTGYRHAPNCPNGLTSTFSGTVQSNTTYNCVNFPGGAWAGSSSTPVINVTFYGCLFKSAGSILLGLFGDNIAVDYSSFEPNAAAPPTTFAQSYQYGIEADGSYYTHVGKLTVSHSDFWGFGNAIDVTGSTQAAPHVFKDNWIHDASADGGSYHTDGIGTLSGSGVGSYVVIDHNTIESAGNTNGLAFQQGTYDHFTIKNNLFGGFGYTIALWAPATYTTFTDNTFSTFLKPTFGPLYSTTFATSTGSTWRRNKWLVPAGAAWGNPAHSGWYWLPTGGANTTSDNGYVSQTDFAG